MDPINIPPMLAYIPYMDPMGYGTVLGNTRKKKRCVACGKKKHNYKYIGNTLYIVLIYSNSNRKNAMSLPCLNIRGWILHFGQGPNSTQGFVPTSILKMIEAHICDHLRKEGKRKEERKRNERRKWSFCGRGLLFELLNKPVSLRYRYGYHQFCCRRLWC